MNFCKDCLHYCRDLGTCKAVRSKRDLVSGLIFCVNKPAKDMRYSEAFCGAGGRWFEKREEGK